MSCPSADPRDYEPPKPRRISDADQRESLVRNAYAKLKPKDYEALVLTQPEREAFLDRLNALEEIITGAPEYNGLNLA